MKIRSFPRNVAVLTAMAIGAATLNGAAVKLLRTPEGGIQPQAAIDDKGVAHLLYLKGDPKKGELFYTRLESGESFRPSIQVASADKGAMAIGNIRGAQIAAGKNGRVHVAWMGDGNTMYYARLNDAGNAFEAPRNLITWAGRLDGGGTVAADRNGNVFVAWNGSAPDNQAGELGRAIFLSRSSDEGKTFSREEQVSPTQLGVCACCGMRGYADSKGRIYFLYRAADGKSRDMTLLASDDGGKNFKTTTVSKWPINTCPMSSSTMAQIGDGILAATESRGQVSFATFGPRVYDPQQSVTAPGVGKRKHPVVAVNSKGETLFAWTENMGWAKGGSLAWQLYDANHKPIGEKGSAPGVPVWSLITGFAQPNGDFVIVY